MKKVLVCFVLLVGVACVGIPVSIPGSDYEAIRRDLKLEPLPIDTMEDRIYTKGFAKRFNLPAPAPENEPQGGIQAVEFSVEDRNGVYSCILKVYLDNTLPIEYPEDSLAGNNLIGSWQNHFFLRELTRKKLGSLSNEDQLYRQTFIGSYEADGGAIGKAGYEGPDVSSNSLMEFHRKIMPGLAYLKVRLFVCKTVVTAAKVPQPQLWFRRAGSAELQAQGQPFEYLKYDVPRSFFERQVAAAQRVEAIMATINAELLRRYGEAQRQRGKELKQQRESQEQRY
jgi:hypothetical protein